MTYHGLKHSGVPRRTQFPEFFISGRVYLICMAVSTLSGERSRDRRRQQAITGEVTDLERGRLWNRSA